jgi:hypothetical protein
LALELMVAPLLVAVLARVSMPARVLMLVQVRAQAPREWHRTRQ